MMCRCCAPPSPDRSPTAHPIRPESYREINNFYTATVYEKGAEVIRMLAGYLGDDGFRKGMDLYFARHDGQAVTCGDFVTALADATGTDLTAFAGWYGQAGTPRLTVTRRPRERRDLMLEFCQDIPETAANAAPAIASTGAAWACRWRWTTGSVPPDSRWSDGQRTGGVAQYCPHGPAALYRRYWRCCA